MRITTNYSRSDWNRFIPNTIISLIPVIILFWSIFNLYIPFVKNSTLYLNFLTEDEILVRFINHLIDNKELQTGYLTPDGWILFFMVFWVGAILAPIWIVWRFHKLLPAEWIIKKLGIEIRMKLVIFVDGKPLKKFRQLFGR